MADDPNVLLVVLDSVRAKNVQYHGADRETAPYLTELTDDVTTFWQARSPDIHSISSHVSLFTGHHTEEHGVTEHESYIEPDTTIWRELSDEHGYETGIFTPNVIVTEASNLSTPFDTEVGPKRTVLFETALSPGDIDGSLDHVTYLRNALNHEKPIRSVLNGLYTEYTDFGSHDPRAEAADVYVDSFLDWVDEADGPWAGCLNLMDAHSPYVPEPEYNRWSGDAVLDIQRELSDPRSVLTNMPLGHLRALEYLYDGCIRQLDAAIERLVAELKRRGEYEETLLVITSDHGEGFGERSRLDPSVRLIGHRWGIAEELTHVPLLVKEPTQTASRSIDDVATITRFPEAVRATIRGERASDEFVPPDGVVRSSTNRIVPPGDELPFAESDREKFFGPWIARYRNRSDCIIKYATRRETSITLQILDAQTIRTLEETDQQLADVASEELGSVTVESGDAAEREIDKQVENRLDDLGYLR